jgi:hypothetical protein
LECSLADMSASQMRVEDILDGASNWFPWKARIVFVLEDLELWDIVEAPVPIIPITSPVLVEDFKKRSNTKKRTICDAMWDHIIPHLTRKTYAYDMWAYLYKLYESSNENRKLVLHDQLRGISMLKDEPVNSFIGRYTNIRYELQAIGEVVNPNSMVRKTLNSLTKPWVSFIRGIVSRQVMPTWERMWDEFIQKETRLVAEASRQQQQQSFQGDKDLLLEDWLLSLMSTLVMGFGPQY